MLKAWITVPWNAEIFKESTSKMVRRALWKCELKNLKNMFIEKRTVRPQPLTSASSLKVPVYNNWPAGLTLHFILWDTASQKTRRYIFERFGRFYTFISLLSSLYWFLKNILNGWFQHLSYFSSFSKIGIEGYITFVIFCLKVKIQENSSSLWSWPSKSCGTNKGFRAENDPEGSHSEIAAEYITPVY